MFWAVRCRLAAPTLQPRRHNGKGLKVSSGSGQFRCYDMKKGVRL